MGPPARACPGRRRTNRLPLLAPDERDVPDRRPSPCDRPRGAHVLIAGTTGSGKSSLLWAVVAGLSTAIHAGLVRVTWLDPKGGMEATPAGPLAHVIDRIDDMADQLDQLVAELDQRAASLAGSSRQHTPSVSSPHRVVVVDELATLTALADSKTARRVEAALGALLSRAAGLLLLTIVVAVLGIDLVNAGA